MNDEQRACLRAVTVHEAAHAAIARYYGCREVRTRVERDGTGFAGYCQTPGLAMDAEVRTRVGIAGFVGASLDAGFTSDQMIVMIDRGLARWSPEDDAMLAGRLRAEDVHFVAKALRARWSEVNALADQLAERAVT